MGKKKKKKKLELSTADRYESRIDRLLSEVDPDLLRIWFGDDEAKRREYGQYLLKQSELDASDDLSLLAKPSSNKHKKKLKKEINKFYSNINDMAYAAIRIPELRKRYHRYKKKCKKLRNRDLGVASYMRSDKYRKKYINADDYRKSLRKIANQEKKELDEARRLGFIQSKDVDKELRELLSENEHRKQALSDAYIQKTFVR